MFLATGTRVLASTSVVLYVVSAVAVLSAVVFLAIIAYFHYNHWRFSHIPQPKRPRYNHYGGLWHVDVINNVATCHGFRWPWHKQMWLSTQSPWCVLAVKSLSQFLPWPYTWYISCSEGVRKWWTILFCSCATMVSCGVAIMTSYTDTIHCMHAGLSRFVVQHLWSLLFTNQW